MEYQPQNKNEKLCVVKSNGERQPLDYEKINNMAEFASKELEDVSPSEIAMNAQLHMIDGISTNEIQNAITDSAHNLISDINPGYQYAAARLFLISLYKEVLGKSGHPTLHDHIHSKVRQKLYDASLAKSYSMAEMSELNNYIDYSRDDKFSYAGLKQMYNMYVIQDRTTGKRFETPQQRFMVLAMAGFVNEPSDKRLDLVKDFYDSLSNFEISLPTPIIAGVGGVIKQYASCCLIRCGDSMNSITATSSAVAIYGAKRAGIGTDVGEIRAEGSPVHGGTTSHTGILPYLKYFHASQASASQGGLRKTSSTLFYPIWHLEFEKLIVLKNNRGTDENRLRHVDYGVKISKLFYQRFINDENITLFSPSDVPGLYDAFHQDQELFERMYIEAENDPNIRKKTLRATEVFDSIVSERSSTGRIYIANIDHINNHGAFNPEKAPVYQSNLCLTGDTPVVAVVDDTMYENLTLKELDDMFMEGKKIKVLSKNTDSGDVGFKPVTASALTKKNAKIMRITDEETGKSIRCTPEHKVYTKNRGYVEAQHLSGDDILDIS